MTGKAAPSRPTPWLHRFALALVTVTFVLVVAGGTVTSKGAGLAVPDWPTSYGYNMFLFPPSLWQGGIFWEHVHRLLGSLVGMLCIVMALALWIQGRQRRWLRGLGVALLALVILQGVMGGLRVTELSWMLGVVHGITAQLFLCLTVFTAAALGRYWQFDSASATPPLRTQDSGPRTAALILLSVMFVQLVLGAWMRHSHSGLAIHDFPTSYGGLIPPTSQSDLQDAIMARGYDSVQHDLQLWQVWLHFAHRVWAIGVVLVFIVAAVKVAPLAAQQPALKRPLAALAVMLLLQIALGALTIWTGRHPEAATAHQALGAATLATTFLFTLRLFRVTALPAFAGENPVRSGHVQSASAPPAALEVIAT